MSTRKQNSVPNAQHTHLDTHIIQDQVYQYQRNQSFPDAPSLPPLEQGDDTTNNNTNNTNNKNRKRLRETSENNLKNSNPSPQPTIASKKTSSDVLEFILHMSLKEANKLSINDKIDYRNIVGLYIPSIIIDKDDSHLMIRNIAYEWDRSKEPGFWIDYKDTDQLLKLARYGSISKRPKHRFPDLEIGHYIDVRPVTAYAPDREYKLWIIGEVVEFDSNNSGQVKIVYIVDNYKQYQWSHLDNTNEIQPLQTKQTLSKPPIIISDNIRHQKKKKRSKKTKKTKKTKMSGHKRKRKNKSATKTQEPKAKKRKLSQKKDKKENDQSFEDISVDCFICSKHFNNSHKYKKHLRKRKQKDKIISQSFEDSYYISVYCHICKEHFNDIYEYGFHLKEHYYSDESKTWRHCDLGCTVNKNHEIQTSTFTGIFPRTQSFLAHIASHTSDRPFKCNVHGCDNDTSSKSAHKRHWKRYHAAKK